MNISVWLGAGIGAVLLVYGGMGSGGASSLVNSHGLVVVLGGTVTALLVSTPLGVLWDGVKAGLGLFLPDKFPSPAAAATELTRLARVAQEGGGLLALQGESPAFAEGFLSRAVTVSIAAGETSEARRVLEEDIRQRRIRRNEDQNIYRTAGLLAPMFGIMGTLVGMIQVLSKLSDPTKVGPAMALALSSAFIGIAVANALCIPIAGQLRLWAMRETLVYTIILEGVLQIALGKPPAVVELRVAGFLDSRDLPQPEPRR